MKYSELQQIIKEELENILINEDFENGLTSALMDKYKGESGKPGLIISKFLTLEKVLKQLKKISSNNPDLIKLIDLVLETFNEIRKI